MATDARPDWQVATVIETVPVTSTIRRITVRRPATARAAPGSHLDVQVDLGDRTDTRSYSVVSSNDDGSELTLSVLLSAQSRGGSSFMHRLVVGDAVMTSQPLQNFPLQVGAERYVLLAGGIGITAIMAMTLVLKALRADYTVVYVGRSRASMAFLAEMRRAHGERLRLHVDDEGSSLDVTALLGELAADPRHDGTELYMCGPIRLMDAVRRGWTSRGLPLHNLRYETFGNSGWFDPEPFVVRIPRLDVEVTVDAGTNILEALVAAGTDVMFDCRKGECGLCQVDVLRVDGLVDHRDVFLSEEQRRAGSLLCTCVSRVVSRPARLERPAASSLAGTGGHTDATSLPTLVIDVP